MWPSRGSEAPKVMLRVRCTVKQSGCVRPSGLASCSSLEYCRCIHSMCVCVVRGVSISVFIVCVCVV